MASERTYFFYKDVLPFAAMVTMECTNVGLNTLYKAATLRGMSYHVFVVYSYAVAAFLLLPAPFFSGRSSVLPPVNFSIVSKIGLLGIIGCTSQIMGYTGIIYSSPTLASAISNLVPAFTFILAVIFRMETLSFSKKSTRAKFMGTIVSVAGAFVVTLYKGPKIIDLSSSHLSSSSPKLSLGSPQPNWAIGGLFLSTEYILVPLWYIVQTQIMKEYPSELTVVFFYNLIVSILAAIVGAFSEPDSSVWKIKPDIALVSILCSGVLGSCLNNSVHTWALRLKGPLFVAMFKPLSIAIAVAMGVMFLGDDLYLGSVIGATIISIGFYTVMWGKGKESTIKDKVINLESSSTPTSPLLQNYKDEDMESR
ncbi:WAT1-related protein At3g28050-like [Rutidosis leptorrhynchoides]|uniref:WAT1-related protein At3g28050-like n=1 Tax=Rutidosis leptorrhynchoides TaxID=125765 RepID=UPI003A9A066D